MMEAPSRAARACQLARSACNRPRGANCRRARQEAEALAEDRAAAASTAVLGGRPLLPAHVRHLEAAVQEPAGPEAPASASPGSGAPAGTVQAGGDATASPRPSALDAAARAEAERHASRSKRGDLEDPLQSATPTGGRSLQEALRRLAEGGGVCGDHPAGSLQGGGDPPLPTDLSAALNAAAAAAMGAFSGSLQAAGAGGSQLVGTAVAGAVAEAATRQLRSPVQATFPQDGTAPVAATAGAQSASDSDSSTLLQRQAALRRGRAARLSSDSPPRPRRATQFSPSTKTSPAQARAPPLAPRLLQVGDLEAAQAAVQQSLLAGMLVAPRRAALLAEQGWKQKQPDAALAPPPSGGRGRCDLVLATNQQAGMSSSFWDASAGCIASNRLHLAPQHPSAAPLQVRASS